MRPRSLACLATALLAASAPASPTSNENARAAALQKDVDELVAAGVPGAILLVRDGDRTLRLTGGLGDIGHKTPMNARNHFKIASLTKSYTRPSCSSSSPKASSTSPTASSGGCPASSRTASTSRFASC